MAMKLFVLGRSGSGKSTTVHYLQDAAQKRGWSVEAFNEYDILHEMCQHDEQKQFRLTEHGGFEVLDLDVYNTSLQKLEQKIKNSFFSKKETLITIEFASNNYTKSLNQFSTAFLQNAHYIFLAADLYACLERISQRYLHHNTKDDFFVPEIVLLSHYPCPYIPHHIHGKEVKLIENLTSLKQLQHKATMFFDELIRHHYLIEQTPEEQLCEAFQEWGGSKYAFADEEMQLV